jgi:GxxExxY protein
VTIAFDGAVIPTAYRADLIVDNRVLVELKSVDRLLPVHVSQTLTYLRHSNLEVALLLNFNVKSLRDGIRRFDNRHLVDAATPPTPPTRSSRF